MSRAQQHRTSNVSDRKVWVIPEPRHNRRAQRIARVVTAAALQQAQREADAARDHTNESDATKAGKEGRHE